MCSEFGPPIRILSARDVQGTYAIRFNPSGWTTQAGRTYAVSVTGISTPINYSVQVVDCP
jgi:hypothetical protein